MATSLERVREPDATPGQRTPDASLLESEAVEPVLPPCEASMRLLTILSRIDERARLDRALAPTSSNL